MRDWIELFEGSMEKVEGMIPDKEGQLLWSRSET